MSAAIYAVRSGVEVTVIADEYGGQINNTDKVENYLGIKEASGTGLVDRFLEHMRDYDVEEIKEKVVGIERPDSFELELESGEVVESRAVIVATGGHRRRLDVPGEEEFENKGVGYCAVCDGPLYQGEEVAVIGAGYSGTEAADYLTDIAEKIYVIDRGEQFTGEEITKERVEGHEKIKFVGNAEVEEFYGDQMLQGVRVNQDGEQRDIEVTGAFVEIGTVPNSHISELWETDESARIKVDENFETREEGLYAAGDVNNRGIQQLIVSASEGCQTALNAADYIKGEQA